MKRSIAKLPKEKQEELGEIVSYITKNSNVEMIILFGSHARGSWVDDSYVENGTTFEYKSDYDLLVVVEDEVKANKHKAAKRLRQKLRRNVEITTPINLIYHGIDYLNQEITDGNYFFTDLLKEGIRLYHSKKYVLAVPQQLTAKKRVEKAQLYFDKWFESANGFYKTFEFNFRENDYNLAVFQLHQATERYFMTTLLVFTDYKPKIHDVEELHMMVSKLDARFYPIFPRQTEEEERLFTILKKAYIDSRYKMDYKIKKEELEHLSNCVLELQQLTEVVCREKLVELGGVNGE